MSDDRRPSADGAAPDGAAPDGPAPCRGRSVDVLLLASLLVTWAVIQIAIIAGSICPAPDAQRYITFAHRLSHEAWLDVLRDEVDHPGYPVVLHAIFTVAGRLGIDDPPTRAVLAQGVSSLFGLVVLASTWLLCRRMWGRAVAWCAAFALVALPRSAWLFADVLSDPMHAAFWSVSALVAARGLREGRPGRLAVAGLIGSIAYATRVDALTLPVTVAIAPFLSAFANGRDGRSRALLRRRVRAVFAYLATFAIVPLVFLAIYGAPSPKPSFDVFFELRDAHDPIETSARDTGTPASFVDTARAVLPLASIFHDDAPGPFRALADSLGLLGQHVQFVHLALAGAACVILVRTRRAGVGPWFAVATAAVHVVAIAILAMQVLYADVRYFLPCVPFVVALSASTIEPFAAWIARRRALRAPTGDLSRPRLAAGVIFLVSSLAFSLPSLVKRRLHQNDHGSVQAGAWLAEHVEEGATIHDPRYFPTHFAGLDDRRVDYLVPEVPGVPHYVTLLDGEERLHSRLRILIERGRARRVAHFPRRPGDAEETITVWRIERRGWGPGARPTDRAESTRRE